MTEGKLNVFPLSLQLERKPACSRPPPPHPMRRLLVLSPAASLPVCGTATLPPRAPIKAKEESVPVIGVPGRGVLWFLLTPSCFVPSWSSSSALPAFSLQLLSCLNSPAWGRAPQCTGALRRRCGVLESQRCWTQSPPPRHITHRDFTSGVGYVNNYKNTCSDPLFTFWLLLL